MIPQGYFGRRWNVTVGEDGQQGFSVSGLRTTFNVQYRAGESGSATIELFNPAPDYGNALLKATNPYVRLEAGYEGSNYGTVFEGIAIPDGASLERRGPDVVLRVEARDPLRNRTKAPITLNLSGRRNNTRLGRTFVGFGDTVPVITYADVLDAIRAQTGIQFAYKDDFPLSSEFPGSACYFAGPAEDLLERIALNTRTNLYYANNTVTFARANQGTLSPRAPLFSAQNNSIIGSPKTTKQGTRITAPLEPSLRPGQVFSASPYDPLTGAFQPPAGYTANEVAFVGDSHGNMWQIEVYGRPLATR